MKIKNHRFLLGIFALLFTAVVAVIFIKDLANPNSNTPQVNKPATKTSNVGQTPANFPVHKDITVSIFWVGELADNANDFISNKASAWDENWVDHFGGEDNPDNRNGFYPADFTPKENPFYFALPYNDLDSQGDRKPQASQIVYWSGKRNWQPTESMCKNQWIKVSKSGLNAYAQWEDVGPFGEDDAAYVFGNAAPSNTEKSAAGLDVSPAVRDYLNLSGIDNVDWQFVSENDVPSGPWKQIITTHNGDSTN